MMVHMHVLKYLWSDAVLSACHLINRMPSSVLNGQVLFSCLYPTKNPLSIASRVFVVRDLSLGFDKLSSRSIKCVFVEYSRTQKGYQCYSPHNRSILCLLMSHSLNPFHSSLHKIQLLHQSLFRFHHPPLCLHMLLFLMSLCQYHWRTLQNHPHHSLLRISDTSTLVDKKFLPLNQFWWIPSLQWKGPSSQSLTPPSDLDVPIVLRKGK